MSHTSSASLSLSLCVCVCVFVDMDMPACLSVCVCLCVSSWIREAHGNTYCIAVAADPSPSSTHSHTHTHTHTHTQKYLFSLCDQWRAHVCPLYWLILNMQSRRHKTWTEAYQLYHTALHTCSQHAHTHFYNRNLCVARLWQWKVLPLRGFNVYESACIWKCTLTLQSLCIYQTLLWQALFSTWLLPLKS